MFQQKCVCVCVGDSFAVLLCYGWWWLQVGAAACEALLAMLWGVPGRFVLSAQCFGHVTAAWPLLPVCFHVPKPCRTAYL